MYIDMCTSIQLKEMTGKYYIHDFLYSFKKNTKSMIFISSKRITFSKTAVRLTKYILQPMYYILLTSFYAVYLYLTLNAYFDPESDYSLTFMILWLIPTYHFLQQTFGYVSIGFVVIILSTLYLKFSFDEIRRKIKLSLIFNNTNTLMKAISDHNTIAIQTKRLNSVICHTIFPLYYFASPTLMLDIYFLFTTDI